MYLCVYMYTYMYILCIYIYIYREREMRAVPQHLHGQADGECLVDRVHLG